MFCVGKQKALLPSALEPGVGALLRARRQLLWQPRGEEALLNRLPVLALASGPSQSCEVPEVPEAEGGASLFRLGGNGSVLPVRGNSSATTNTSAAREAWCGGF